MHSIAGATSCTRSQCAPRSRPRHGGRWCVERFVCRASQRFVDHGFATHSDEQRTAEGEQFGQVSEQAVIVLDPFAKSEARVDHQLVDAHGRKRSLRSVRCDMTSWTTSPYLGRSCMVSGVPCMCMMAWGPARRRAQEARDQDARRNVVDHVGSCIQRPAGHFGVKGVHADGHVGEHLADGLEGRLNPLPFGRRADAFGSGPAALAAEIEEEASDTCAVPGPPPRPRSPGFRRGRSPVWR